MFVKINGVLENLLSISNLSHIFAAVLRIMLNVYTNKIWLSKYPLQTKSTIHKILRFSHNIK